MGTWIRRAFTSAGLTQVPSGRNLPELTRRHIGGTALLLIDVSNSMYEYGGMPITSALAGACEFIDRAVEAHYDVGVIMWHTVVAAQVRPTSDGRAARDLIDKHAWSRGGTSLLPALLRAHEILADYSGDRVVALFGDGDVGAREPVLGRVALMKSENIRFVTRGLGPVAAQVFGELSDEDPADTRVDRVEDLAASIAGMAANLRKGVTAPGAPRA